MALGYRVRRLRDRVAGWFGGLTDIQCTIVPTGLPVDHLLARHVAEQTPAMAVWRGVAPNPQVGERAWCRTSLGRMDGPPGYDGPVQIMAAADGGSFCVRPLERHLVDPWCTGPFWCHRGELMPIGAAAEPGPLLAALHPQV